TERDKAPLLEGLQGAAAERGARADRASLEQTISALGNRIFLLHNIHRGGEPKVFQTRWALSYLRGPMTREEIARLMEPVKQGKEHPAAPAARPAASPPAAAPAATPGVPSAAELAAVATPASPAGAAPPAAAVQA